MNTNSLPEYLTVTQTAEFLNIHRQHVYELIWRRELEAYDLKSGKSKTGRAIWRVPRSGLETFLESRRRA